MAKNNKDVMQALEASGQRVRRGVGTIVEAPAQKRAAATETAPVSGTKTGRKAKPSFWSDKEDYYSSCVFDKTQYEALKRAAWWHRMSIKEMMYRCIEEGLKTYAAPEED